MKTEAVLLEFQYPFAEQSECIGVLSLNRPEIANAFHSGMIAEIDACLHKVEETPSCRLLLVQGKGKHFSGGADLGWMKEAAGLSYEDNLRESQRMAAMFERLYRLSIPTVAVIKGAAYGGAVGLTACCDFAIATRDSKFCLSEVKLGLLPAVIFPFLARKLTGGQLKRLSLTGTLFRGEEALNWGLVEVCCAESELAAQVSHVVRSIFEGGPRAQKAIKRLYFDLERVNLKQDHITSQAIAKARSEEEGQQGLHAFFAKSSPAWRSQLPDQWTVEL